MKHTLALLTALLLAPLAGLRAEDEVTWLVHYEASSLPQEQGWQAVGALAEKAKLANGALRVVDDSAKESGAFRATWKPQPDTEVVVEAVVRVESVAARRGTGMWPAQPQLHITLSEPWDIPPTPGWDQPRHGGHELKSKDPEIGIAAPEAKPGKPLPPTRPYLYDVGKGVLMLSVAQGPDAIFEPYGVLRSTDAGKTWVPVKDLQFKTFAPQPHLRLPDDSILGVSRWNVRYEPGTYVGMSYRFDPKGESFTMFENLIRVPKDAGQIVAFDRDIWDLGNGKIMTATYTRATGDYAAYLLMSTDAGATWNHFSTIGVGPEPSVVRFSDTKMMAILRTLSFGPLLQTWSHDGGQTWTKPIALEEGSVAPDMVLMSNGVLACSYGRPGSNLMFSTDQGQTWIHHTVITDSGGFNYTALREISPGRLLYVHDAPKLKSLYVDVKVTKK